MSEPRLPSLADLSPDEAWQPWPKDQQPWEVRWAAHLLRRAGFGAPPRERGIPASAAFHRFVETGCDAALDRMLAEPSGPDTFDAFMDQMTPDSRNSYDEAPLGSEPHRSLQAWWLHRLALAAFPLRERMTLFWHNHFATSLAKVRRVGPMLRQNQLFRKHALGSFKDLLLEVSRDSAMLLWLDSASNVKEQPNENYARELMELFTLGVGNYSEADVREAARAFTGWSSQNYSTNGSVEFRFQFLPDRHDSGRKIVLGQTGNWDGSDVVRIVLEQPAAGRWLAKRLYRQFVSEQPAPPEALLEPLAQRLRESDYQIAEAIRMILRSRLFFSQHAYRRRIKSPVDYVVGLLHQLGSSASPSVLSVGVAELGQELFAPPSVKGWDGGSAWLNTATLLARHNVAWAMLSGEPLVRATNDAYGRPIPSFKVDVSSRVREAAAMSASQQVAYWLDTLLHGDVPAAARDSLEQWLTARSAYGSDPRQLTIEFAHTITALPEFQLC
jgi:uncharacterized protein (DUF1800 family)